MTWDEIVKQGYDKFLKHHEDLEYVVRCKDCHFGIRYFDVQNGDIDSWVDCTNPDGLNRDVSDDGYCSAGIRRKADGKETEDAVH